MTSVKRSETRIPPGLATLVVALLAWEALSLFFPPVIFPGPWTLLERMVAIYSDPASYAVIGQTLLLLAGTAFRRLRDIHGTVRSTMIHVSKNISTSRPGFSGRWRSTVRGRASPKTQGCSIWRRT